LKTIHFVAASYVKLMMHRPLSEEVFGVGFVM
jgi:hypothetical protein